MGNLKHLSSLQHIEATPADIEALGDFRERYITAFRWMLLSRAAEGEEGRVRTGLCRYTAPRDTCGGDDEHAATVQVAMPRARSLSLLWPTARITAAPPTGPATVDGGPR